MGKRVLIGAYGFADRMVLRELLASLGYHVVGEAKEGRAVIERYQDLKPDLVVVELPMPDMDGVATVREIRYQDPDATVLICASRGQRGLATEALHAGAKDLVLKPIQPRRLHRAIQMAMK